MRVILAALVLLTIPTADWELLGTRRVSFTLDHDAIIVGPREGGFIAIKIEVVGGNLEMYNVKVTFGNGQTFSRKPASSFMRARGVARSICRAPCGSCGALISGTAAGCAAAWRQCVSSAGSDGRPRCGFRVRHSQSNGVRAVRGRRAAARGHEQRLLEALRTGRSVPPLPTNGGVGHESRRLCVRGPLPRDPQHLAAPHLWRDRVCDRRWFRHRGARHETLGGANPGEQRLLLAQLLRS